MLKKIASQLALNFMLVANWGGGGCISKICWEKI